MARYVILVFAFMVALSSCTGGRNSPPTGGQTESRPGASGPRTSHGKSADWKAIVYSNNGDVWVFDRATGKTRNLSADGDRLVQDSPRFIDDATIAYNQEEALYTVDWRNPSSPRRLPGSYGPDWDIDRDLVATEVTVQTGPPHYLETDYLEARKVQSGRSVWRTKLRSSVQNTEDETSGREQTYADERRVEWAPDGRNVLVSDTLFYPNPKRTLFVVSREGKLIMSFEGATYARWVDNESLIYRSFNRDEWQVANLSTRMTASLGTGLGRANPSVEPTTGRIAFDTTREYDPKLPQEGCTCSIVILDTPGGAGRKQSRFGVFPVWLSEKELAVTEVRACPRGSQECRVGAPMWESLHRSIILKIGEGGRESTLPFETFDDSTGFATPTVMVLRSRARP